MEEGKVNNWSGELLNPFRVRFREWGKVNVSNVVASAEKDRGISRDFATSMQGMYQTMNRFLDVLETSENVKGPAEEHMKQVMDLIDEMEAEIGSGGW